VFVMCLTFVVFLPNIPGFALFVGDHHNKSTILQRSEYAWVQEVPGAIVFGEMFEPGPIDFEIGMLTFSAGYGIIFFVVVITHSAV
ncbi:hypothetical protein PENTCL1PPCAC_20265, partial [Pristionchus entomophagus]